MIADTKLPRLPLDQFHSSYNAADEKLYIPLGRDLGGEKDLAEVLGKFKQPKRGWSWNKMEMRMSSQELLNYSASATEPFGIGFVIPKDIIVVDIDDRFTADIVYMMLEDQNIRFGCLQTTKGKHFFFKFPQAYDYTPAKKQGVRRITPIGASIDTRTPYDGYIVLPWLPQVTTDKYGNIFESRAFIKNEPFDSLDELPWWLVGYPNKKLHSDIISFPLREGGRNDALQRWAWLLVSQQFTQAQTEYVIKLIARYICIPRVPEGELMQTILRSSNLDEAVERTKKNKAGFFIEGVFMHHLFADYIVQKYNVLSLNQNIYIYQDGVYLKKEGLVEQVMISEIPIIKRRQRKETMEYIRFKYLRDYHDNTDPYDLVCQNGILDMRTGKLKPFSPDKIYLNKINIEYHDHDIDPLPQEQVDFVHKFLWDLTDGDQDLIMYILQMFAYTFWKTCKHARGFIFHGEGGNGKSKLLDFFLNIIGLHNTTSLEFNDLTVDSHKTANLENKLACITGDISDAKIKETQIYKKVVTGDIINVNPKNITPYDIRPYATMIMSANGLPNTSDKTSGFFDRVEVVPFRVRFRGTDREDKDMDSKIANPDALKYFLYMIVQASIKLFNEDKFTYSEAVHHETKLYRSSNDSFYAWSFDAQVTANWFDSKLKTTTYEVYTTWCIEFGAPQLSRQNFYKKVIKTFPELTDVRRAEGRIWKIKN